MSNNYVVCSLCGAKIEAGTSQASKLEKNYGSPLWSITQYFCPTCSKKLSVYVYYESEKIRKKLSKRSRRERLWRNLKNSTHQRA